MKNMMTPNITLAIVLLAAMAAVALRAAARGRPEPRWRVPGAGSAPIAVRTPRAPGRSASAVEQMQDIFHELHADGRNAACTVCDSQYCPA